MNENALLPDACWRVLKAIQIYTVQHHFSPSIRDIAVVLHLRSHSTVAHHLLTLEIAELITREASVTRSIVITEKGNVMLRQAKATPKLKTAHESRR